MAGDIDSLPPEARLTAHDPLHLRFCPQCDYDLQSLPPAGRCPECGREYDQSFVIIRGTPANREQALLAGGFSTKAVLVGLLPWLFVIPATLSDPNRFAPLMAIFGIGIFGTALLSWLNSPRPGEVLVWICAQGIGQQNDFDPDSLTAKLRRFWPWFGVAIYLVFVPRGSSQSIAIWIGVIFVVIALTRWDDRRICRRQTAIRATGIQPDIFDWKWMTPSITPASNDRYRMRVSRARKWSETYPVNIFFNADHDFKQHLEAQIKIWQRNREMQSNPD